LSSQLKNLSSTNKKSVPSAKGFRFGIVASEWNTEITEALYSGAYKTLIEFGAVSKNISRKNVPGSFELPLAAQFFLETKKVDAVLCLGCVIQGETKHFDFICQAVSQGIMDLNLKYKKPVIFGVLTTNSLQQAKDRSGGKHGNKGDEAAVTAIKMLHLLHKKGR